MKKQTKTNKNLVALIKELKEHSSKQKTNFWKKIALELEKPTRRKRTLNLSKIEKYTKDKETVIVPGKVLGMGELKKDITVSAFQFSDSAKNKIKNKLTIKDLMEKNPTGKGVKILG